MATIARSFRLPEDVAQHIARQPNSTEFVVEAIREKLTRDRDQEFEASIGVLVDDNEDLATFHAAQRETLHD